MVRRSSPRHDDHRSDAVRLAAGRACTRYPGAVVTADQPIVAGRVGQLATTPFISAGTGRRSGLIAVAGAIAEPGTAGIATVTPIAGPAAIDPIGDTGFRRCSVADATGVAVPGTAHETIHALGAAGRAVRAVVAAYGRAAAGIRRLAGPCPAGDGWIVLAADQAILARALDATVAWAPFTGAERAGAVVHGLTGAGSTGISLDTAGEPVVTGALHTTRTVTSLTGAAAPALLLGGTDESALDRAADESRIAGIRIVEVASAILTAAGRRPALIRVDADVATRHRAANQSLIARADTVRIANAVGTGTWCPTVGLRRARAGAARHATRAAADEPSVTGVLRPGRAGAAGAGAGRRYFVADPIRIAVIGAAARARFRRAAGAGAGAAISAALVRVTDGFRLADAGTTQQIGGRAADQGIVTG